MSHIRSSGAGGGHGGAAERGKFRWNDPGTGLGEGRRAARRAPRDPGKGTFMSQQHEEDVKVLHSMGYAQELSRRMGLFQNFAISFSIICILAGGIGTFAVGFGAAGGGSIGIGWIVGSVFALLVATSMGQIASAYPTAGGLYHWGSILGG